MPNQPPFRMPCEGVSGKPLFFFGSPRQHQPLSDLRDRYVRTTQVPNWQTPPPTTIDAYERWTPDSTSPCEVHHCVVGGAPCSAWLKPYTANTWSHTPGDQVNFAVTHKRGFKNVHAFRYWSGRFGYKHIEDGVDTTKCCTGDGSITRWRAYQSAIAGTKYLAISVTAEDKETQYFYDGSGNPTGSTVNWDDSASTTQSIDPNSGVITPSLTVTPNTDTNRAYNNLLFSFGYWTWADIVNRMTANVRSPFGDGTITCTDTSITVTGGITPNVNVIEQVDWDLAAGTFTRTLYEYSGTGTQFVDEIESVTVSDSSLAYSMTANTWSSFGGPDLQMATQEIITVNGTLTGANTSASVYTDVKTLLAYWPLNDDALYPWRVDTKVSVAPLVTRSEVKTTAFSSTTVKDYGHPITDGSGHTLGDVGWINHTGVLIRPDPNSGTDILSLGGSATNGEVFNTAVSPSLGYTTVTGYSYVGLLPAGCSFDTTTGVISGTCTADCTWGITVTATGAAPNADGSVKGAPLPAGYQYSFNFDHQDWAGCCNIDPADSSHITWDWYQVGWGMDVGTFNSNAGCSLPANATQFTNYFQAVNKPPCAFLFYNDQETDYYGIGCVSSDGSPSGSMDSGALWAGKYAEILEPWPSQNFALPAGDMKFWLDEDQVFCAVNISGSGSGSTWTVTKANDGSTPPDGALSGYWGSNAVGGFYSGCSVSGGVLTMGAKIYDLPTGWQTRSNNDGANCIGQLRFPTAPALLGRVAITPDVAGTTMTFATAQVNFGMDSTTHTENVDIYDASMTLLASNVTATRSDDSHFTVLTSYPTAAFVTITGVKYYINDTAPKGDHTVLEWTGDYRSLGEYTRLTGVLDCSGTQVARPTANAGGGPVTQQFAAFTQTQCCLPFVPCAPKVVCISPNGETWANGVTYDFPAAFACDELYGSKWWGSIQSVMSELFWQKPHRPCNIDPTALWKEDDYTCPADSPDSIPPVYYFGQPPQVEARLTVPTASDCASQHGYGTGQDESAPALPTGIQIGWLSPVTNSAGDIALPPVAPGAESDTGRPAGATTAWSLHDAICAAIAAHCRFNYSAPGC